MPQPPEPQTRQHQGMENLVDDSLWRDAAREDGAATAATDEIYGEIFEHAREGLEQRGLSTDEARQYIRPLRERVDRRLTPARWKHDYVRRRVEENVPLAEAIWGMQATYIRHQEETLLDGSFVDWFE